jgi:hypothetical protein
MPVSLIMGFDRWLSKHPTNFGIGRLRPVMLPGDVTIPMALGVAGER